MSRRTTIKTALRRLAALLSLTWMGAGCGDLPVSINQDEYGNEYENFEATPPQACTPAGTLSLGDSRGGSIEDGDCAYYPGERYDRWTLSVDQRTAVRIDMRSDAFDTFLELLDARGGFIAMNDDSGGSLNSRIVVMLAPGDYDVIARTYGPGMRGAYEIGVHESAGCGGGEIVLGDEMAGAITDEDCLFDQWTPADSMTLTLAEDTRLDVTVKSADFRPMAVIRDARGWDVFGAYDHAGAGTAHGRVTLGAGTYALYVLSDGPELGDYQLLVEEVGCDAPLPVTLGETVEGTLDELDCVRSGGAFRDAWSLELDAERSLRIDLASDDLDPWLAVLDEDGLELANDDDSGPGFDASLAVTLGPGRYTLVASSFAPGLVGDYTLSVAEEVTAAAGVVGAAGVEGAEGDGAPKTPPPVTPDYEAVERVLDRLRASPKIGG